MFCQNCGNRITDGIQFCPNCGAKLAQSSQPARTSQPTRTSQPSQASQPIPPTQPSQPAQKNNNAMKKILIAVAAIVVCFILIITVVAGVVVVRVMKGDNNSEISEVVESEGSEATEETEKKEPKELPVETEAAVVDTQTENVVEEPQVTVQPPEARGYTLMMAVPTESMNLRTNPGFGDDIIEEIPTGRLLRWDGKIVTKDDEEFLYVTDLATGNKGYLRRLYCTEIDYECDESKLGIVNTSTALYTYDMMVNDIMTLCNTYPDLLSYEVIGQSLDGRDIYAVTFGNANASHHVMVQSTIHGREYMNTQLVMRMIEYNAAYYNEAFFRRVIYSETFEDVAFHIIPMINPDGVSISQFGLDGVNNSQYKEIIRAAYERDKGTLEYKKDSQGDWRWLDYYSDETHVRPDGAQIISFEEYVKMWKTNARGVDLNRNFDAGWAELDQKKTPAYTDYKGDYPVSEPETQILVNYATRYNFDYYISYHSKGELIYYDVIGNSRANSAASTSLAELMKSATSYTPKFTAEAEDVVLGGFGDWVQLSLNKPAVTVESGKHPCPLQIDEFYTIWNRHRESWARIAQSLK